MKKFKLNATSLKVLLIATFIVISSSMVGGFYYAHDWLKQFATESNINIAEPSSTSSVQPIDQPQEAYSQKASSLILSSAGYLEKIEVDLLKYASDNSIRINISEASPDIANGFNDQAISGIQSKFIIISFDGPVNFTDLLKFINGVETNLPKIKIMGIIINRVKDSTELVTVSPITLKVYSR